MTETNPCLRCGACCALFKVAFEISKTNAVEGGSVPMAFTVKINTTRCAMRGTETKNKRCMALEGRIGQRVSCAIYDRRPQCCHDFRASWEKDIVNPNCNRARAAYGLPPFDAF